MNNLPVGPRWAKHLLHLFCAPHLVDELDDDLDELFQQRVQLVGLRKARWRYIKDVLSLMRPSLMKRQSTVYQYPQPSLFSPIMIRNYVKIAWRNLVRNKSYSAINIVGLSVGMAVAMLIGLWVWDELSFNKYHQNYDRIAQVMQRQTTVEGIPTFASMPFPLATQLRTNYSSDFKRVVAVNRVERAVSYKENTFTKAGLLAEADFPDMMTLTMLKGNRTSLADPHAILLSQSLATTLFGELDPINKIVELGGNKTAVKVTGIYEDLPYNTAFNGATFIAPFALLLTEEPGIKDDWHSDSFDMFVQLNPNSSLEQVSAKISNRLYENNKDAAKPTLFVYPMSQWHLYSEFKNGQVAGGRIQFVWLFGIIGIFVLLLACINFMNLSTARSEKRAKEVGIRKAVGSVRGQLIGQFLSESLLVVALASILSFGLVLITLPWFNAVADKQMTLLWNEPVFWLLILGFSLLTGLLAGSYPAFYLSSFQPIKVLKGPVSVGRFAAFPRHVLVVVQFTVSVTLVIGTIIVFRQIQYAKNRPIGYSRDGLLTITMNSPELAGHYDALRNDLLQTGTIANMAESSSPTTDIFSYSNNLDWRGKDPNRQGFFGTIGITEDFGETVGWKIIAGRDLSRQFTTDSLAFVFNEAAVKLTGLKSRNGGLPIGEIIKWHGKEFKIIGVVKDMVMSSPFEPIVPTVFMMNNERELGLVNVKLNPHVSASEAISSIEAVMKKYNPTSPFDYKFANAEYDRKFRSEERIGKLASFFAVLAIFISCLGLFGLSSFIAEQRIKEIGVRKVLGATVPNIVSLLSKDFLKLVFAAFLVASPIAWYTMNKFLQTYTYRIDIEWWVFALTGVLAISITLLTVSFQSIKAALTNPVKSLRSE